ncbi:DUF7660 family protein [Bradyrhizobium betae]
MSAFLKRCLLGFGDMDGYYQNDRRPVPATPDWRNIAEMLLAAKVYE